MGSDCVGSASYNSTGGRVGGSRCLITLAGLLDAGQFELGSNMAAESHIEWLLAGQDTWNRKRESTNFRPEFWRVNFVERFRDADKLDPNGKVLLTGFNLSDAVFQLANLSQVDFRQADLRRARFQDAFISDTNFSKPTSQTRNSVPTFSEKLIFLVPHSKIPTSFTLTWSEQICPGRGFGRRNFTQNPATWGSQTRNLIPKLKASPI